MLNFLIPKTQLQAFQISQVDIEQFDIYGIGQINPYCQNKFDNEVFVTVVNFANGSKRYDEKEGLILSEYFTIKKCPRCKRLELIPVKIKINLSKNYDERNYDIDYDSYYDLKYNFPSNARAYCNACNSCFEFHIKHSDSWVREAKKIKEKDLITKNWEEYRID